MANGDYDDMEARDMMYDEIQDLKETARDLSKRLEKAHEEIARLREALEKIVDPMTAKEDL